MAATAWSTSSWRARKAHHQPVYKDQKELKRVKETLSVLPALVSFAEVKALREKLTKVYEGKCFYLQGGHCAETFDHCNKEKIQPMLDVMNVMTKVISEYTDLPVVTLGRMAGQYAKPRSKPTEVVNGVEMESYKGDLINAREVSVKARTPDPNRMMQGYFRSAACLNFIRSTDKVNSRVSGELLHRIRMILGSGEIRSCFRPGVGFGNFLFNDKKTFDLQDQEEMRLSPGNDFFISHEGLLLEYEESLTRFFQPPPKQKEAKLAYNASTHMIWIGHRTRGLEDAHVEYFRGIYNPIGVKVGPGTTVDVLLELIQRLNPNDEVGKIVLISRFGAEKVLSALPPLVEGVKNAGVKVIWICDPMHGNTYKSNGYKTRNFTDVVNEIVNTIAVHEKAGTRLNGLHLEMCGEDVTECVGGPDKITSNDLSRCFLSACDPRLNYKQSLAVAFAVGMAMKKKEAKSQNLNSMKNSSITYGKLPGLKKSVSKLIFGTLFLERVSKPFELLDKVVQSGCNAFDTAAIYGTPEGKCERILGEWMKSRNVNPDDIVIITKGGCRGAEEKWAPRMKPAEILEDLNGSLQRLGVDSVDCYLLHRDDPSISVQEIVDMMNTLVVKGKVKCWGVSNWSLSRLNAAMKYAKKNNFAAPVVDSTQASLAKPVGPVWPGTTYMTADRETFYTENKSDVSVFAWESLAKGFLTGKWTKADVDDLEGKSYREKTLIKAYCTPSNFKRRTRAEALAKVHGVPVHAIALAYLLHLSSDMYVLVGTSKMEHFVSNLAMFDVSLSPSEVKWLRDGGSLDQQLQVAE